MSQISKKTKWSYAVGCIGRDMNFLLVSMFVLPYIQYTMNLSLAQFSAVTTIMILARVWDAVNDPMMGTLIENVRLKGGKFRPWILLGGVLNFLVTLIMFWIRPQGWSFVAFFGVVYITWGMTYTINDISYHSLLPNLAGTNESRNKLANLVMIFASIGQFTSGGLIPVLVTGNAVMMYKIIGIVVSFFFLGFTLLTYFGVTENPSPGRDKPSIGLKKMFSIIFHNDQLIIAAIGLLFYTISTELFVATSMNYFYFHFGYGGSQLMFFTFTFAFGTMAALAAFGILSKKYPRAKLLKLSVILSIVGHVMFSLLGLVLPMNQIVLYISTFLVFFGHCMFYVILVIYIANTIEYNEVKTGDRNDPIIAAVRPFMTKLGAAVQQLVFSLILLVSGIYSYSQKISALEIEKSLGNMADITNEANIILSQATENMKHWLKAAMGLIPLVLLVLAYVYIKKKYIITEEKFEEYVEELKKRA